MTVYNYSARALTGGGAGALDSIDGSGLNDGDAALVWYNNQFYPYILDDDSGQAESSPDVIAPDSNPGDKRWLLQNIYGGNAGDLGAITEKTLDTSGIVAISSPGAYTIDTYGDAASDDLEKIEGLSAGNEVVLMLESAARPVTVKKGTFLKMQGDFAMTTVYDAIRMLCVGSNIMVELSRAKNA